MLKKYCTGHKPLHATTNHSVHRNRASHRALIYLFLPHERTIPGSLQNLDETIFTLISGRGPLYQWTSPGRSAASTTDRDPSPSGVHISSAGATQTEALTTRGLVRSTTVPGRWMTCINGTCDLLINCTGDTG